jgi:hypothetical protein
MIYEFHKPDNRDKEEQTVGDMLLGFILGLIACLLITLCSSCTTTKYVEVPVVHNDTVLVNHMAHDSIWVHDSTYIKEKGDTFLMEKWHTKYVLKELHDTTYISKTDTIPTPYPVIQEVPAEFSAWQKLRMDVGTIAIFVTLAALIGVIAWRVIRKKFLP